MNTADTRLASVEYDVAALVRGQGETLMVLQAIAEALDALDDIRGLLEDRLPDQAGEWPSSQAASSEDVERRLGEVEAAIARMLRGDDRG